MTYCVHPNLLSSPSAHASACGFTVIPPLKRKAATTASGRVKKWTPQDQALEENMAFTFPSPLILPEDDLSYDPAAPPQSFLSWKREKARNEVTDERKTIYVARPPRIQFGGMKGWDRPAGTEGVVQRPRAEDVVEYLAAFYYGMPVKTLPGRFTFDTWASTKSTANPPPYIAINRNNTSTRIRTRACPDGIFDRQLNLNDLLDACLEHLPSDAYSLLLLVEQDIYEDDDDDFCCGRAYGGSRIAVVSSARYDPLLDEAQGVEREHAWPASHCAEYVEECCSISNPKRKKLKHSRKGKAPQIALTGNNTSPLRAAITAHTALSSHLASPASSTTAGLWLGRVCRTASHELGHCLGMDHCVYYACVMQSTASGCEDVRQPPHLCPVDLAKMLKATGAGEEERYEALLDFCQKRGDVHLFVAFGAWLEARLRDLKGSA